ncbi:hypothetical protein ACFL7M_17700 [Thermodesulfobacteriota bacterium]
MTESTSSGAFFIWPEGQEGGIMGERLEQFSSLEDIALWGVEPIKHMARYLNNIDNIMCGKDEDISKVYDAVTVIANEIENKAEELGKHLVNLEMGKTPETEPEDLPEPSLESCLKAQKIANEMVEEAQQKEAPEPEPTVEDSQGLDDQDES